MHMLMITAIGLALLALFQVGTMLLNRHRAGRAIKSQHVFIWIWLEGPPFGAAPAPTLTPSRPRCESGRSPEAGPVPALEGLGLDNRDGLQHRWKPSRYSRTRNNRSPFVRRTRPRTFRRNMIS
jgi:hypothetical protein